MYYSLKKNLKLMFSVGFNPKLWIIELATMFIKQQQKRFSSSNLENPYLLDILTQKKITNLDHLTVSLEQITENPNSVESLLTNYGICIIKDFVPHDSALQAGEEMIAYFNGKDFLKPKNSDTIDYKEEQNYLWQTDSAWTDNYLEAANFNKPLINIRSRQKNVDDAGMIDIFNIQQLAKSEKLKSTHYCIDKMADKKMVTFLTNFTGYSRKQFNLYYNNGVTKTRGPHIDNNSDPFKLFVYLTDVVNDSDGPYCYLPGSSTKRDWMSFERLKNIINRNPGTEVSSLPRESLTKIFGKAGTAIITNQSGVHCGGIQSEDGERVLLVSNYY